MKFTGCNFECRKKGIYGCMDEEASKATVIGSTPYLASVRIHQIIMRKKCSQHKTTVRE